MAMILRIQNAVLFVALWFAFPHLGWAQGFTFSTVAGAPGWGTADGTGSTAEFHFPGGMVADGAGFLVVADTYNHCIRKVEIATGVVTTFAGTAGTPGAANGTGVAATFKYPVGLVRDSAGSLYVADSGNFVIRKITSGGEVTTFAGQVGVLNHLDGIGTGATFSNVQALAIDEARDFLYIADTGNHLIRRARLSTALVETVGGAWNEPGAVDGAGTMARFRMPAGLAVDSLGNLHVADSGNHVLRLMTTTGAVFTSVGMVGVSGYKDSTGVVARLNRPMGLSVDAADNLYVADLGNGCVRKVTKALVVATLGPPTLNAPRATVVSGATVYVTDTGFHAVRSLSSTGEMSLLAGRSPAGSANGVGAAASFHLPEAFALRSDGVVFIADTANHVIRRVARDGMVSTFAGVAGSPGSSDGGTLARFNAPAGIVCDAVGNLYVADTGNHMIRRVGLDGVVTTLAGLAGVSGTANGAGVAARFHTPLGLAVDVSGNVYVADSRNHTIRRITPAGVVSTFAGGAGVASWLDATGAAARFNTPTGLDFDSSGNLYVADRLNRTVRRITSAGVVSTFAGAAQSLGTTNGTGTAARFGEPAGVAVDGAGNVWVSDVYFHHLRRITPARVVTTPAGAAWLTDQATILDYLPYGGDVNGPAATASFYQPSDIAFDVAGLLYVMDRGNCLLRKGTPEPVAGAPVISTHPATQTVISGAPATFTVAAAGSGLTYQWYKDSILLGGQTADTLVIPTAAPVDEAAYRCVVTGDTALSTPSYAGILRVVSAPVITVQPVSVTVGPGASVTFAIKATGQFLNYQWMKNGSDIPTGTDAKLTLTNVQLSDDDVYTVEVTNAAGGDVSDPAMLKVLVAPAITTAPAPVIAARNALSASFTVGTTGTYLSYQWYKGSKVISATTNPSAITATLLLSNVQLADAADYKVVVKNTLGSKTSVVAPLVVVDTVTATSVSQVQGKAVLMNPAVAGNGITNYQWRFNGTDITVAGSPAKYVNFTKRTLTVNNVIDPSTALPGDEGAYTCRISTLAGSLETGPISLEVITRPVVDPITFVPAMILVSQPFSYVATAAHNPTKFTITGLPKGLSYNASTGVISGSPVVASRATVATEFMVKISASNAAGASLLAQQATLRVNPFNPALLGTYQGRVVREGIVTDDLGGRISITVPASGVFTGSLAMNKITSSFTGALNTSTADPTAVVLVDRKAPLPDLRLSFSITSGTRSLVGTIENGSLTGEVFAAAGHSTPFAAALPATPADYVGNYTLAASHAVAGDDKPQGYSVAAFKVAANGVASGVLKMADSSVVTLAGPVGQGGNVVVYALLYGNTGSVHGLLNLHAAESYRLDASVLGWTKKLQTKATRYFVGGFGPLDLSVVGRRYVIPASVPAVGLAPGPNNAKLTFTEGLAPSPTTRLDIPALEIQTGNPAKVLLPANVTGTATNGSHAKMALSVVPGNGTVFTPGTTGAISGSFTLVDQDLTALPVVKNVIRATPFTGMIVDDGLEVKAYGWFLLSEMPNSSASPYRSGKVVLSAP